MFHRHSVKEINLKANHLGFDPIDERKLYDWNFRRRHSSIRSKL